MPMPELQTDKGSEAARLATSLSKQISNRKVVAMRRKNGPPQDCLAEDLTSALRAADSEFGQILQELDEISELLKSGHPDTRKMKLASRVAVWGAVKQAFLDRELRYLALTDDLTCLFNRRGFFAAATQQLKLAQRNGQNLLLFFCDVDNLKRINDTYGHHEGDLALIRTADALEQSFRDSDILSRLGGDEFVALASETSAQTRDVILRRLEKNLKKSGAGESRYPLSLGIGVAQFDPKHAITLGELMVQADKAMYEKKRNTQKIV